MNPLRLLAAALAVVGSTRRVVTALVPDSIEIRWGTLLVAWPVITLPIDCDCNPDGDPGIAAGHADGDDCPCQPLSVPVERPDGEIVFITVHRADPDTPPESQADRAATVFEVMDMARLQDDD